MFPLPCSFREFSPKCPLVSRFVPIRVHPRKSAVNIYLFPNLLCFLCFKGFVFPRFRSVSSVLISGKHLPFPPISSASSVPLCFKFFLPRFRSVSSVLISGKHLPLVLAERCAPAADYFAELYHLQRALRPVIDPAHNNVALVHAVPVP